jgi:hypothetical protein
MYPDPMMAIQLGSHSSLRAWSLVNTVLPSMGMPTKAPGVVGCNGVEEAGDHGLVSWALQELLRLIAQWGSCRSGTTISRSDEVHEKMWWRSRMPRGPGGRRVCVDALATLVMDTHRTHARTSAHTWWHERHYKLGLANKDVLGGAREGVGGSRQRGSSSAQQREERERKSVCAHECM